MDTLKVLVDISASATTSEAVDLGPKGRWLMRLGFPAALTSDAFTIQVSDDGVTYRTFYKDGADKSWVCAASKEVDVTDYHIMANFLKVVLDAEEEADRTLTLTFLPVE